MVVYGNPNRQYIKLWSAFLHFLPIRPRANYALNFEDKLGNAPKYTGWILAVGIAYNRKASLIRRECRVEILRDI